MKKLVTLLLLFPFLHLQAQSPGLKNVVGGQINFLSLKGAEGIDDPIEISGNRDEKTRLILLQPYIGWKISDHTLLGIRLGYQHNYKGIPTFTNTGQPSVNKEHGTNLSAAVFARYYLRPAAKFGLFFEPSLAYTHTTEKGYYNGGSITSLRKNRELSGMVWPGISYHATERLGLLLRLGQVGYIAGKEYYEYEEAGRRYDQFLFNFNLTSFAWGVEYRWGKTAESN